MIRVILATCLMLASAGAPWANETAITNALKDAARAQERQAESLRRIESMERDRARRQDAARQNAERDSRSMRRFD